MDIVTLVSHVFDSMLEGRVFDTLVAVTDDQGLVIKSYGEYESLDLFQAEAAVLIEAFSSSKNRFKDSFEKILDFKTCTFQNQTYYIDDIGGDEYYLIAVHEKSKIIYNGVPFLQTIVKALERTLGVVE
ncbi:MAG: hypothetical protein ACXAC7_10280 [Candidatus Hodarchaeales archaeon]|jgi:hypothetical protein